MRKLMCGLLLAGSFLGARPSAAQQVCPGLPYVANTPEDELMQAVNGAENPQEQIAALDKFTQAHADSKFIPCVDEYYTLAYLKLNNYDKVIEYGEKGLGSNYQDMMLVMNLLKAYLASGKVSETVFAHIQKAPDLLKSESNPPRPPQVSDADWQKAQQDLAAEADQERAYVEYACLQLVARVPDGNKRLELLDQFVKTFPDAESKNAAQLDFDYFIASKMANQPAKAVEYGEKTIVADPNNVAVYNLLAYDYAVGRTNPDKAAEYAKKALDLAQAMKKPEGVPDEQFTKDHNNQLGMAHLTLGYVTFLKSAKSKRLGPAIQEFQNAIPLLEGNPELQGQALYYLGYAYEGLYPANHQAAADALTKAANLQSPWQSQAKDLLAKVRRAAKE